eukprot:4709539-Alexandrium_andersonii.AAC.1
MRDRAPWATVCRVPTLSTGTDARTGIARARAQHKGRARTEPGPAAECMASPLAAPSERAKRGPAPRMPSD